MLRAAYRSSPTRYLGVGALVALLQNLIMILADYVGLNFMISNSLCYALIGSLTYVLHSRFTFSMRPSKDGYIRFMAGLFSAFCVASVLFFILCGIAKLRMIFVAPTVTIVMIIYNYVSARWAILNRVQ